MCPSYSLVWFQDGKLVVAKTNLERWAKTAHNHGDSPQSPVSCLKSELEEGNYEEYD